VRVSATTLKINYKAPLLIWKCKAAIGSAYLFEGTIEWLTITL
jgi:hypothetical protein